MGKGASIQKPNLVAFRNGMIQIRYNVQPVTVGEGDDKRDEYKYDYVEIQQPATRKQIIDTLIRTKHDVNDEFALLALSNTDPEYIAYRDFIMECKTIADSVINVL